MLNDNKFYIYILSNSKTPYIPFYVGKGTGRRLLIHERLSKLNKHCNRFLQNKILKILKEGNSIITLKVFDNISEEIAYLKEKELIIYYKSIGIELCNLTRGGDGGYSIVPWNKGISLSEETKQKIRKTLKEKHFHLSKERIQKLINANTNRHPTEETRTKLIIAAKNRKPMSQEIKDKIRNSIKLLWDKGERYVNKNRNGRF